MRSPIADSLLGAHRTTVARRMLSAMCRVGCCLSSSHVACHCSLIACSARTRRAASSAQLKRSVMVMLGFFPFCTKDYQDPRQDQHP